MSFLGNFFGPPDVQMLKAKRDVDGLIKALGYDKDPSIPREAAKALSQMGPAVAEPIKAALPETDSVPVRKLMIMVLSRIARPEAIPALVMALGDNDDSVQQMAAIALAKMSTRMGSAVLKAVFEAFTGDHARRQDGAFLVIKQIAHPRLIKPLMGAAHKNPNSKMAAQAADALGEVGQPAMESLVDYIEKHPIPMPRWPVRALGQIGGDQAVDWLIEIVSDEQRDHEVRRDAAEWLGTLKDRKAVEPLITVMQDQTLNWYVRGAAAKALGEIGDRQAIGPLNQALDDRFLTGRQIVVDAIEQIENTPLPEHFAPADIYKAGSWWSNPPGPYDEVENLTVIGARTGEKVDSVDINEAMKAGYIAPDALIYLCDTLPAGYSDEEMETAMIEVAQLVAEACHMDWEGTEWALGQVDTRVADRYAVLISSGL